MGISRRLGRGGSFGFTSEETTFPFADFALEVMNFFLQSGFTLDGALMLDPPKIGLLTKFDDLEPQPMQQRQSNKKQRFAKELKLRRFSIAPFQVGQQYRAFLLGACFPHDLAAVQRLTLARRLLGCPVRQQVFHGEWLGMRGMSVESMHQRWTL